MVMQVSEMDLVSMKESELISLMQIPFLIHNSVLYIVDKVGYRFTHACVQPAKESLF